MVMLGVSELTSAIVVRLAIGAILTAIAMLLIRDSVKGIYYRIRTWNQSTSEWYEESIDYLQGLIQAGSNIQASSELREQQLRRVSKLSEEFVRHSEPYPSGVEEEVANEVIQIAYISGWVANLARDLDETTSMGDAIELFRDFRQRQTTSDMPEEIDLVEVFSRGTEGDHEKADIHLMRTMKRNKISFEDSFQMGMTFLNEAEEGFETLGDWEDFPWDKVYRELDAEVQERLVSDLTRSIISIYLIETPEEAIQMIQEAR